jgi:hypothetical protein
MACFAAYVESNFQMQFKEHMNLCNKQVRFVFSIQWWCKVQSATIERLESHDRKTWIKCLDTCFQSLNLICCVYNSTLGIGAFLLLTDGGILFSQLQMTKILFSHPWTVAIMFVCLQSWECFLLHTQSQTWILCSFKSSMFESWTRFEPCFCFSQSNLLGHMNCGENIILCLQIIVVSHDGENSLWLGESLNKCEPSITGQRCCYICELP